MALSDYTGANKVLQIIKDAKGVFITLKDRIDYLQNKIDALNSGGSGIGIQDQVELSSITATIQLPYTLDITVSGSTTIKRPPIEVLKLSSGNWICLTRGVDYIYSYPSSTKLRVSIYSSGDFKINY